jgi:hypothetical protein
MIAFVNLPKEAMVATESLSFAIEE